MWCHYISIQFCHLNYIAFSTDIFWDRYDRLYQPCMATCPHHVKEFSQKNESFCILILSFVLLFIDQSMVGQGLLHITWTRISAKTDDDVIKWKHVPRYWPFVRGVNQWLMSSPHKGQWGGALIFSLICAWTNDWANNRDVGDLRRHHRHYDVIAMTFHKPLTYCVTVGPYL